MPFPSDTTPDTRVFDLIDQEVQRFLTDAADRAFKMLSDHRGELDAISQSLLKNETIDRKDLAEILGDPVPRTNGVDVRVMSEQVT